MRMENKKHNVRRFTGVIKQGIAFAIHFERCCMAAVTFCKDIGIFPQKQIEKTKICHTRVCTLASEAGVFFENPILLQTSSSHSTAEAGV